MEAIRELLLYFNDHVEGLYVSRLLHKYGRKTVCQTAITLLAWLRKYGDGVEQPLGLRRDSQLDPLVVKVFEGGDAPEVLELRGWQVDFRSTVHEDERRRIASFVAERHRPEKWLIDG